MTMVDAAVGDPFLDFLLAGAAGDTSGTIAIPAAGGGAGITLTKPFNVVFDATRATSTVAGTPSTGTSSVSLAGKAGTAAAPVSNVPTKNNDAIISITATASGTWNGIRVMDSTGTPKRVVFGPSTDLSKGFASADVLAIPVSQLTATLP
jgi:hypothetical protein